MRIDARAPISSRHGLVLHLNFLQELINKQKNFSHIMNAKDEHISDKPYIEFDAELSCKHLHLVSLITIDVNVKNAARRLFESERSKAAPSVLMSLPTVGENRYPYEESAQKIGTSN